MRPLRVRAYNIEFGDALLVSVPEIENGEEIYRNILIDVGSKGTEGCTELYEPVVKDILKELQDRPLDLYVATHEHMDHVQGLPHSEKNIYENDDDELKNKLGAKVTWFSVMSRPGYFDEPEHAFANEKYLEIQSTLKEIDTYLSALQALGEPIDTYLELLWAIGHIGRTKVCVDYIKTFNNPNYVFRGFDAAVHNLFTEASIEVWAPENDVGIYFSAFTPQPMNLGNIKASIGPSKKVPEGVSCIPPSGVDAGAFYNLVASRQRIYENLLAASSSFNNTSIVFCLNWRGNRLLFTGDAEEASWEAMYKAEVLKKVDFLKISHHGSENGTPEPEILNQVFPDDDVKRYALVSTIHGAHQGVPDEATIDLIESRCEKLYRLDEAPDRGKPLDIFFQPK